MQEIDLHGVRLHEAEEIVLRFIDQLYAQGEACGRIIHGHGVIASHLDIWARSYPHVAKVERDPGNSGSTVVWLQAVVG